MFGLLPARLTSGAGAAVAPRALAAAWSSHDRSVAVHSRAYHKLRGGIGKLKCFENEGIEREREKEREKEREWQRTQRRTRAAERLCTSNAVTAEHPTCFCIVATFQVL